MNVDAGKQLLHKALIEFGLGDKEARVYLALLELEAARANEISKKTSINRSSTYVVIESLKKKGLVSMSPDKSVQAYIAASPEMLLQNAKEQSDRSIKIKNNIEELLPELRALHKETAYKPKVIVFEGEEALKMSYHSTFKSKKFRIFKNLDEMKAVVPEDYIKNDSEKRKKEGVKMLLIAPDTKNNSEIVAEYKKYKSPDEFVLIPKNKFSSSNKNIGIGIYDDRVKFASGKDKFSIFIVNQAIADTLRDLFDLAWNETRKNSSKK
jgi:sugar-specific transcriptional regulator TrmB